VRMLSVLPSEFFRRQFFRDSILAINAVEMDFPLQKSKKEEKICCRNAYESFQYNEFTFFFINNGFPVVLLLFKNKKMAVKCTTFLEIEKWRSYVSCCNQGRIQDFFSGVADSRIKS
jgi:hypothetical protein